MSSEDSESGTTKFVVGPSSPRPVSIGRTISGMDEQDDKRRRDSLSGRGQLKSFQFPSSSLVIGSCKTSASGPIDMPTIIGRKSLPKALLPKEQPRRASVAYQPVIGSSLAFLSSGCSGLGTSSTQTFPSSTITPSMQRRSSFSKAILMGPDAKSSQSLLMTSQMSNQLQVIKDISNAAISLPWTKYESSAALARRGSSPVITIPIPQDRTAGGKRSTVVTNSIYCQLRSAFGKEGAEKASHEEIRLRSRAASSTAAAGHRSVADRPASVSIDFRSSSSSDDITALMTSPKEGSSSTDNDVFAVPSTKIISSSSSSTGIAASKELYCTIGPKPNLEESALCTPGESNLKMTHSPPCPPPDSDSRPEEDSRTSWLLSCYSTPAVSSTSVEGGGNEAPIIVSGGLSINHKETNSFNIEENGMDQSDGSDGGRTRLDDGTDEESFDVRVLDSLVDELEDGMAVIERLQLRGQDERTALLTLDVNNDMIQSNGFDEKREDGCGSGSLFPALRDRTTDSRIHCCKQLDTLYQHACDTTKTKTLPKGFEEITAPNLLQQLLAENNSKIRLTVNVNGITSSIHETTPGVTTELNRSKNNDETNSKQSNNSSAELLTSNGTKSYGVLSEGEAGSFKTLTVENGPLGLGFCIQGGMGSAIGDRPISVKRLFKGHPSIQDVLKAGDEILSVNGRSMSMTSQYDAWNYIKSTPTGPITIIIRRHKDIDDISSI